MAIVEMMESAWFPWVASLVVVIVGAPSLVLVGYPLYVIKTPEEKRSRAGFVTGTIFLLTMMYSVSLMAFSGFLSDSPDTLSFGLTVVGLLVLPATAVSSATAWLLRRKGWGQPRPRRDT
ncbi:hypothetical protein [Glycomyces buryatensis]|uniref:Uncharacterized protein n=1 Tax=Glycomyces buryatensis TaxID=2570927 RepID=A0A4V4HR99_9ACTN|nr:hypothetical protein [Glycomyces buryatensis]THV36976.1 hypothetical protein FAB82_20670 [Glycomyces buryatensis]